MEPKTPPKHDRHTHNEIPEKMDMGIPSKQEQKKQEVDKESGGQGDVT